MNHPAPLPSPIDRTTPSARARPLAVVAASVTYAHPPVGSHYWARWLTSQGYDVVFLSAPVSPLHLAGSWADDSWQRMAQALRGIVSGPRREGPHLWSHIPAALVPAKAFSSKVEWITTWVHSAWPSLRRLDPSGLGRAVDLFYTDYPIFLDLLERLKPRVSIYRLADSLHSRWPASPAIMAAARRLAARANLTVYASTSLEREVADLKPRRQAYLPNGYEGALFERNGRAEPPQWLASLPHPRLIYVGQLAPRLDVALVKSLAQTYPHGSIILAGYYGQAHQAQALAELRPYANVHFPGFQPYEALPSVLAACDVALIPFVQDHDNPCASYANPLKLYQYLAMGLPVVATATPGLRAVGSSAPIFLAEGPEDFLNGVHSALDACDTPAMEQRVAFARQFTFEATMQALFDTHPDLVPRRSKAGL